MKISKIGKQENCDLLIAEEEDVSPFDGVNLSIYNFELSREYQALGVYFNP
jgi:hypothetical protein